MANASEGNWVTFVRSPLGLVAGFLAVAALLFMGIEPPANGLFTTGQLLLAMIALGCVAVLSYRVPQAETVPVED